MPTSSRLITLILIVALVANPLLAVMPPAVQRAAASSSSSSSEIVWSTTTNLPARLFSLASVVYNGRAYVIGGHNGSSAVDTVYYASINDDGALGNWQSTRPLPDMREGPEVVVYDGRIYVLGGSTNVTIRGGGRAERATVWFASVNADGTVGSWTETTSLPDPVIYHTATVWNGRIYLIGGWTGYGSRGGAVHYANINSDGSLGSWISTTSFPASGIREHAAVVHNGVLYVIGGEPYYDTVYYARINTDGTVGSWSTTTSMPSKLHHHSAVVLNERICVIGGEDNNRIKTNLVRYAPINSDGTLGSWSSDTSLPKKVFHHASVVHNGRIYVIGGTDGVTIYDTAYYSSEDWPMFHHDLSHTGYSTSTAPLTNNTLWTYTTGGFVASSPSVASGRLYVGSGDSKVYSLNASTGALIWSYTTGGVVSSSPDVAGGLVYVGSDDHKVYALNASTGALRWSYTTGSIVESSPAVAGGIVYVGVTQSDGKIYALNASAGTLIWSYQTAAGGFSPPAVRSSPAVANGVVYVGCHEGKVYALNATTGVVKWSYTTGHT